MGSEFARPTVSPAGSARAYTAPTSARNFAPQAGQIHRRVRQRELYRHAWPVSHPEPPHPVLLFQRSYPWFHDLFPLAHSVARPPGVRSFRLIRCCRRIARRSVPPHSFPHDSTRAPDASPPRRIHPALLQRLHILLREKSAVRAHLVHSLPTLLLHSLHHRHQQLIVRARLSSPAPHDQIILAHRHRPRIPQTRILAAAAKSAVLIRPRQLLPTPISSTVPIARDLPQLFLLALPAPPRASWDRTRTRRPAGGGLPFLALSVAGWVLISTMATFPEAPQ